MTDFRIQFLWNEAKNRRIQDKKSRRSFPWGEIGEV